MPESVEELAQLPGVTRVRSVILSFLSPQHIVAASKINENWWEASQLDTVWSEALKSCLYQTDIPLVCVRNPVLMAGIVRCLHEEVHDLFALREDDGFFRVLPQIFGLAQRRFTHQLPMLMILFHSVGFMTMRPDPTGREGYDPIQRCWLLLATCLKWVAQAPSRGYVPWCLALFAWASSPCHTVPFHKMMLAPIVILLQGNTPVRPATMLQICSLTSCLLRKYLPPSHENASRGAGCEVLGDNDERAIFSVFVYVLMRDCSPDVEAAVQRAMLPYGEWGMQVLAAAALRVEILHVAKQQAALEREAHVQRSSRGTSHQVTFEFT